MSWNQGYPYPGQSYPPPVTGASPYPLMPAPPLYPSLPPGAAAPQPPLGGHYPSAPAQPYPPVGVCPTPPQHCQGHWVPASSGHIPPYAVGGGFDHGSEIFVARAHFRGALLPGKLVSGHRCCYVAWGGKEHSCSHYEVLTHPQGGSWVSAYNFPCNAVLGGRSENGEPLYVGRAIHHSSSAVGKIQRSHGVLYYSYGGKEHSRSDYEVLVLN